MSYKKICVMYTLSLTTEECAKKKHSSEESNNVPLTCLEKVNNILDITNPVLMTELVRYSRPRYIFGLYKGSWGHELLGALTVSYGCFLSARAQKPAFRALSTAVVIRHPSVITWSYNLTSVAAEGWISSVLFCVFSDSWCCLYPLSDHGLT